MNGQGGEFVVLIAPDTVEYRHATCSGHCRTELLPVTCSVTGVRPDITRKPNPKSSGVILGHHFTRSAGIGAHAWTSSKRHHACNDQSARTRCRCAGQHARIFRCRTRFTRNARRSSPEQSTGSQRSCHTVHEAPDSRTAILRSGCRCRLLTGHDQLVRTPTALPKTHCFGKHYLQALDRSNPYRLPLHSPSSGVKREALLEIRYPDAVSARTSIWNGGRRRRQRPISIDRKSAQLTGCCSVSGEQKTSVRVNGHKVGISTGRNRWTLEFGEYPGVSIHAEH